MGGMAQARMGGIEGMRFMGAMLLIFGMMLAGLVCAMAMNFELIRRHKRKVKGLEKVIDILLDGGKRE